ncbi:MAG: hypothetical protein WAW85_07670 [Gordonia sp. (in: high G+C Gram-positive bacteria)]|uniref:hypothetical protein n=1 Tax=Gordonia sp. (in: high G+C Gram-positive bacteria) TaxID=84139 RepID=UPI003BB5BC03
MTIPSLADRYSLLVCFAHSRREEALTSSQIADRTGLPCALFDDVAAGRRHFTAGQAAVTAAALGLQDAAYLAAHPGDDVAVIAMYERLQLLVEARDLGVQHIAARDTAGSGLAKTVKSRLALLGRG